MSDNNKTMDTTASSDVNTLSTRSEQPHNIEAEQRFLGALLLRNEVLDRVSDFLEASHFFDPVHAAIFETASQLIVAGRVADYTTLRTFFENAEPIDADLTVVEYLWRLADGVTTTIYSHDYARTIYDLSVRRRLIEISEDLMAASYDSPVDLPAASLVEQCEGALYSLVEGKERGKEMLLSEAFALAIERANNAHQGNKGIETNLIDLDFKLGGLQRSDLIILAGRPSMGKTALATNIAVNVARQDRPDGGGLTPVGFFSLEMSGEQLGARILSSAAGVPSHLMRTGDFCEEDMRRLLSEQARTALPIVIDQTGGVTIAQLSARARRMKRKHGIELLIVDYIQLLSGSKNSNGRVQEVTEITTGLKALAKELDIPVIALSQLSRKVEDRADNRPQLSDLRESGSIEQDADIVMFVFREEYYVERSEPSINDFEAHSKWQQDLNSVRGLAEVIIGKQRHGPTGTVKLQFTGHMTQFSNLPSAEGRNAA